jgi:hypothetical protein
MGVILGWGLAGEFAGDAAGDGGDAVQGDGWGELGEGLN